jgi:cell division protein FtsL
MRAYFLAAAALLALAGCQSADEKAAAETGELKLANASMADVSRLSKAARAKTQMQPGQWRTAMTVVSADLSAFPEGPARDAQMQAIRAQEQSSSGCRTSDQLKPLDFESMEKVAGKCVFPRYIQAGGKLDVEIHCGEGASKSVILAAGTISPTGFDVMIDQKSGVAGAANYLAVRLHAKGERTGNCTPKPA